MIDMEQTVYDILIVALPGMKWSVGFAGLPRVGRRSGQHQAGG